MRGGKPVKFTAEQVLEMRRLARKEKLSAYYVMKRMGLEGVAKWNEINAIIKYRAYTWVRPVA